MTGNLAGALVGKTDSLQFKVIVIIIVAIVAIVVVNLLLDGIRKHIRGLDTAALGALLIFGGYKASQIAVISVVSRLMYLIGGTLFVTGVIVFILLKLFRRKRTARRKNTTIQRSSEE